MRLFLLSIFLPGAATASVLRHTISLKETILLVFYNFLLYYLKKKAIFRDFADNV